MLRWRVEKRASKLSEYEVRSWDVELKRPPLNPLASQASKGGVARPEGGRERTGFREQIAPLPKAAQKHDPGCNALLPTHLRFGFAFAACFPLLSVWGVSSWFIWANCALVFGCLLSAWVLFLVPLGSPVMICRDHPCGIHALASRSDFSTSQQLIMHQC
jgi:hypothetical protein